MASRISRPRLVLASGSAARRRMLAAAGLEFDIVPADLDEEVIRRSLSAASGEVEPEDVAMALAVAKAEAVSAVNPGALVIGSDQVLALGLERIDKAKSTEEARATLMKLRGKIHHLHSAVALAKDGHAAWTHVESAVLAMREFSQEFLAGYLARAGDAVLGSVGCYHYEGLGVQLFEDVAGDHFTIQGLPLIPLLDELRARGAIAA